jgi:hypothetical protein
MSFVTLHKKMLVSSVILFRYWWFRIQSLSELGEWMELDKFSKSKKSPIGIEVR